MTDLRSEVERYLRMRQGLGYKYQHQARRLADFASFMEARQATTITTKLAMEWATMPPDRHASWALRLTDVRGFARHLANIDPQTETPPGGILPRLKRAKPYIYSDAEIDRLLAAALALPPADGLRRWTYHHLFGPIAVTGMRLSEAINLQRDDVDLEEGVLTVQQTKFGKSRPCALAFDDSRSPPQLRRAEGCSSRISLRSVLLRRRARRPIAAPVCPSGLLHVIHGLGDVIVPREPGAFDTHPVLQIGHQRGHVGSTQLQTLVGEAKGDARGICEWCSSTEPASSRSERTMAPTRKVVVSARGFPASSGSLADQVVEDWRNFQWKYGDLTNGSFTPILLEVSRRRACP
jgi:hypothetical protein